jgi:hypothetical protein
MLLWLLLMACHLPPRSIPEGEVTLGWRLAPGMELRYQLRATYSFDGAVIQREEDWRYLVRRIDDQGTYTLEGQLEDLRSSVTVGGQPIDASQLEPMLAEEQARLNTAPLGLSLSLDGRIDRLEAASWSDTIPHRLLALRLPAEGLTPGARWDDAETARSFARLSTWGVELDVAGTHRLEELTWHRSSLGPLRPGQPLLAATIQTEAMVRPEDARVVMLEIQGSALWDLEAGRLHSRKLRITERGSDAQPDTLELELHWRETRGRGEP